MAAKIEIALINFCDNGDRSHIAYMSHFLFKHKNPIGVQGVTVQAWAHCLQRNIYHDIAIN